VVFRNAISGKLGLDLGFRVDFLRLCDEFQGADEVTAAVLESIARDFKKDPKSYTLVAKFCLHASQAEDAAQGGRAGGGAKGAKRRKLAGGGASAQDDDSADGLSVGERRGVCVLEEGLANLPDDPEMWQAYAKFLRDCRKARSDGASCQGAMSGRLDALYRRAAAKGAGALAVGMCLDWARLPSDGSAGEAAAESRLRLGLAVHPHSPELWATLLGLKRFQACVAPCALGTQEATRRPVAALMEAEEALLNEAIAAVGKGVSGLRGDVVSKLAQPLVEKLSLEALEAGEGTTKKFKAAEKLMLRLLGLCVGRGAPTALCCQYLTLAHSTQGLRGVARARHHVLATYPGGDPKLAPFLVHLADLATQAATQAAGEASDGMDLARAALEAALGMARPDAKQEVLEAYADLERRMGFADRAEKIRWKSASADHSTNN